MEIKVLFFGVLAEVTGTAFKHYSDVSSINDLKLRIQDDFPEIVHYNYRISLNSEIIDNDLHAEDRMMKLLLCHLLPEVEKHFN